MDNSIKAIGRLISVMAVGLNYLRMAVHIRGNTAKTKCRDRGNMFGLEGSFTKASF
jgi:hypothetical protein